MAKIDVKGLGIIQLEGDTPSKQEIDTIKKLLNKKVVDSIPDIREYKKNNPDTANVPSVELAEKVYNDNYKIPSITRRFRKNKFIPQIHEGDVFDSQLDN